MVNDKLEEKRKHGNFLLPLGIYDVDLGDKEYSISAHWHKEIEIILVNTGEFNLQINSDFYTCNAIVQGQCIGAILIDTVIMEQKQRKLVLH